MQKVATVATFVAMSQAPLCMGCRRCRRCRHFSVTVRRTHLPVSNAKYHGVHLSGHHFLPIRRTPHAISAPYLEPFKTQVIQECSESGASIANIALGYSLNTNLVHK